MPILRELLARELLMLVVITGLGAGPASWLSSRFGAVERVALAPILGMAVGTSVFTTLLYFFRAADTGWLVAVLVAASVTMAVVRSRRAIGWRLAKANLAGWLSLAAVIVVVTVPILSVMRSQHTVGPASYAVGDAIGYVGEADGEVQQSLHDAVRARPPITNLSLHYYQAYAQGFQNLDLGPLAANVNSLTALESTQTWQAFLIAFVLAGALGALAAVRWILRETGGLALTFAGATAGVMFAGAMFLQLYFADSQSGLGGLSLLLALGVVAADAVIEPRPRALALLALMSAGLMSVYPLFVAPTAATGAAVLLFLAVRRVRSDRSGALTDLWRGGLQVGLVLALAILMNLVSFTRDLRYWKALLSGQFATGQGFPAFDMKVQTLPAWLLQTRNLFTLTPFHLASFVIKVEEIALPLLFIAIVIVGLRRFPVLRWLLVVVVVAGLLGEYEAAKSACSYCTDRSLLPIAPILVALLAIGLGVLWRSDRMLVRAVGFVALALWLIPAFTAERDLRNRVTGAGTFLDSADRVALAHLPHDASVAVEGFDAEPASASPAEPFAYQLAEEESGTHATIPGDLDNNNSIAYFGTQPLNAGEFNPNYRYVLTRLPGIATTRQTVWRIAGLALQKRVQSLDVTPDGGLVAPPVALDPTGDAWVSNTMPLRLIVGGPGRAPAYVGLQIVESVPTRVTPHQSEVRWRLRGQLLTVCVRADGVAPFRFAQFSLFYDTLPSTPAPGPYALGPVGIGVRLAAMRVASGRCPYPVR